jgi:ethanolamine utilization microcompartment shell protein EutS
MANLVGVLMRKPPAQQPSEAPTSHSTIRTRPTDAVIGSFCRARSAMGLSGGLSAVDTAMAQAAAPS